MTKNIFDGAVESTYTVEKFTSFKRNTTDVWKNYGYFKQEPCDFSIEKANLSDNPIIHINQDINLTILQGPMRKYIT